MFFLELKLQLKGAKVPRFPTQQHFLASTWLSSSSQVLVTKPVMKQVIAKQIHFYNAERDQKEGVTL